MSIAIVTDSTADIPTELLNKYHIHVVFKNGKIPKLTAKRRKLKTIKLRLLNFSINFGATPIKTMKIRAEIVKSNPIFSDVKASLFAKMKGILELKIWWPN